MSAWGYQVWEYDDAIDWIQNLFEGIHIDEKIDKAFQYSDVYGEIRAACYILSTLGRSKNIWPGDPDRLVEHIEKGLSRLRPMIDPDSESDFMALSDSDPEMIAAVEKEILALETVYNELKG